MSYINFFAKILAYFAKSGKSQQLIGRLCINTKALLLSTSEIGRRLVDAKYAEWGFGLKARQIKLASSLVSKNLHLRGQTA